MVCVVKNTLHKRVFLLYTYVIHKRDTNKGVSKMTKTLTIHELKLDLNSICKGFQISKEDAIEIYSDARMLTKLGEKWAARIFKMKEAGADCKGYDLSKGKKLVSVKSLTRRGSNISSSVYQGAGRSGTYEQIREDFIKNDELIIVDIRSFPLIKFIKLDVNLVMEWVDNLEWNALKLNPKKKGKKAVPKPSWYVSPERFDHILSKYKTKVVNCG